MSDLWVIILSVKANVMKVLFFSAETININHMHPTHFTRYYGRGNLTSYYISSSWAHGKFLNLYYPLSLAVALGHVTKFWPSYVDGSQTRQFWICLFYFPLFSRLLFTCLGVFGRPLFVMA